ncbi:hypothetical protein NBRC116601_05330 [Cognatishimia sp. WU-CL00825]|uniref:DUF4177 domain-containing protein n=1 Tax=Cognatishimia sp. WU-CL00825 TaxID=3127658 RepID=UPI003107613B
MTNFEYKVVPAPAKGQKARGIRKPEDKFANSIQEVMNKMAQDGWEFLRSETLPSEERSGLTSTTTHYRSILVFRRVLAETAAPQRDAPVAEIAQEPTPVPLPAPKLVTHAPVNEPAAEENFFDSQELIPPAQQPRNLPAALRFRAQQLGTERDVAAE